MLGLLFSYFYFVSILKAPDQLEYSHLDWSEFCFYFWSTPAQSFEWRSYRFKIRFLELFRWEV